MIEALNKNIITLKNKVLKAQYSNRRDKHRLKAGQTKMKDYFSPGMAKNQAIKLLTEDGGICRYNMTNKMWCNKNPHAANMLFGFSTFDETLCHIKGFFSDIDITYPHVVVRNGTKIAIKPSYLSKLEQILVAKTFIQSFPHRSKLALMLGCSRQSILYYIDNWIPM